jgi:transcriptional regulator with XRE-family HTH domain
MSTRPKKPVRGRPPGSRSFDADVAKAIGAVLREIRMSSGNSQEALANLAGIERSYWGRVERGQSQPTLVVTLKIAAALGVEASVLVAQIERSLASKGR